MPLSIVKILFFVVDVLIVFILSLLWGACMG